MRGTLLRPSAIKRAKKPLQPKDKTKKADLPTDIKPIIILESSDELPPSILSGVSFSPGMTNKQYWRKVTTTIEDNVKCEASPRLPEIDYSCVLPPNLKDRIKQIMSYDFSESDDLVYIRDEMPTKKDKERSDKSSDVEANVGEKLIELRKREAEELFHESQFSDIERMENEFFYMDLKLEQPLGHSAKHVDHANWISKFLCNPNRVVWETRASERHQKFQDKTLDEQAEELMDMSAERFVEWLKSIGSGEITMTAENIKDLFSIKGDRTLLASITSDPKEVNAIAKTVAVKWNRPDIAIETQYENHIKHRMKQVPKKKMLSAFGRTIPVTERPWYKSPTEVPIKSVYPKELLTRERIFGGIRHLRSVKALINFYLKHPKFERPQYLVKSGDFKIDDDASAEEDIPLYEKLGLKY